MPRRPTQPKVELTGAFEATRWRAPDGSNYCVGFLEDGTTVCGGAAEGELIPGVSYTFYGSWNEHARHGKQFKFVQFIKREPHSRHGLVSYLAKFCHGVGPAIATQLWDAFGTEAVAVLRNEPARAAAACKRLPLDKALAAAEVLKSLAETEATRIELIDLFKGRGFPGVLVDTVIQKWGVLAPQRIRRDPFCLLVNGWGGCGFARCDRLYIELGHNPMRMKRQVICLWHLTHEDEQGNGSTWLPFDVLAVRLGEKVGAVKVKAKRAAQIGVRAGWLAVRHVDGVSWLAEAKKADAEAYLAERVRTLTARKGEHALAVA